MLISVESIVRHLMDKGTFDEKDNTHTISIEPGDFIEVEEFGLEVPEEDEES